MDEEFVIDNYQPQPIADRIQFWVREVATGRIEIIWVSLYDASDADAAARLAIEEMRRRVRTPA